MFGFLIGIGAGFIIWNVAYNTGIVTGRRRAAIELQEFLAFLEPVDRLHFRQKMREFLKNHGSYNETNY